VIASQVLADDAVGETEVVRNVPVGGEQDVRGL